MSSASYSRLLIGFKNRKVFFKIFSIIVVFTIYLKYLYFRGFHAKYYSIEL